MFYGILYGVIRFLINFTGLHWIFLGLYRVIVGFFSTGHLSYEGLHLEQHLGFNLLAAFWRLLH